MESRNNLLTNRDYIFVNNLVIHATLGHDAWERTKAQPVHVSAAILMSNIASTAIHDAFQLSYSVIAKIITKVCTSTCYKSIEALTTRLSYELFVQCGQAIGTVWLKVEKPKALLNAASAGVEMTRTWSDYDKRIVQSGIEGLDAHMDAWMGYREGDVLFIQDLRLFVVVGLNSWERDEPQNVVLNIVVHPTLADKQKFDQVSLRNNFKSVASVAARVTRQGKFKTVEALALAAADACILECGVNGIRIRVEKPNAIIFADSAGVELTRWCHQLRQEAQLESDDDGWKRAFVAIGTNLGNRVDNMERALVLLNETADVQLVQTSFLYESKPMYVQDQPDFLNAVLEIRTKVAPHELLALLKQIEDTMGRHKTIDKGPRVMDLDILLYEHDIIKTPNLIVPHVGMADREFVLAPLADIAPDMQHPVLLRTPKQLLSHLMHQDNYTPSIERVFPVRDKLWRPKQRTFIMGILNVTPDSFSDGGQHMAHDEALRRAREMIQQGADMIDIGGQSTRPGAVDISAEQETARVVPIIQALRQQGFTAPISVDTFRADVARAALDAGADMINDVSGATRDPQMLPLLRTITSNRPAVCLMHMRGDSATMQSMAHYTHVVPEVAQELADRVHNVLQVGVPRWRVWIDPGIGFAKHTQHNMELLRNLQGLYEWYPQTLRQSSHPPLHGYPMLVGPSRKAFLGTLTKRHVPNERVMGSVAACIVAVNSGANMVRVHDVQQVKEALLVVDQVWKQ